MAAEKRLLELKVELFMGDCWWAPPAPLEFEYVRTSDGSPEELVESFENCRSVSGKFGGVAGVFAGVHICKGERDDNWE